ncbi:ABC transporter ATP-binding protein [Aestuariivirga sp.]|jgi:ABC-type Fe3+/spermidine/putrescine transport system ATPase subunit|uniref:ABC transporter ATP-binding protein n=1 Tax=Aestuariivirga sp. TaxID=2650926 RepID=UPI003783598E
MTTISVTSVSKSYGAFKALDDVSIDFADGEFFGLLGPSGSGKTTLLRAIAGFVTPDQGRIAFDGEAVDATPVHKRRIGMVFQSYALFPHLSVARNLAFGLEVRGDPQAETARRIEQYLALVRLSGLGGRRPRELSGGQQQRVALARALITEPRVLLLDEPLGALDRKLRQEMQVELRDIQRRTGITTIFVTHDQEEALTLSDRIAIINEGRIVQSGTPQQVYERPVSIFAAQFLGDANILRGTAAAEGLVLADGTMIRLPAQSSGLAIVRPEKIRIGSGAAAGMNALKGVVMQSVYSGASVIYRVAVPVLGETPFLAFVQNASGELHQPGAAVTLSWEVAHTMAVAS